MKVHSSYYIQLSKKKKEGRKERKEKSQMPVAHTCNPSYSGGKDQENCSSRPTQRNSSKDPILKIANTKKGLME
jgi:hypothetical protein